MNQEDIEALRGQSVPAGRLLIGDNWQFGGAELDVFSPIDGSKITAIADATPHEVDAACKAARNSFESGVWANMPPAARKKVLSKWADLIEAEALALTVLGVRDNGTEIGMAFKAEAGSAAATFRYYAEAIDKVYGEIAPTANSVLGLIHREPVGVVGAIVPWNFPLMIGAWKLAPALAAGNSVVLKPGETASLSLLRLAQLGLEAGLPEGVLNVVTGRGAVAGEALALSMEVDVLAFTGSGATGARLLEYSARSNLKRVYLELGGKSPNVVFADADDLDCAAKTAANGIFRNSGQVCVAGSRLIVEDAIASDFTKAVCGHASKLRVGDPLSTDSDVGSVHSPDQLERVLGFVNDAEKDGNQIVSGGNQILKNTGGTYMEPTVIEGVRPGHTIWDEEVFGPVLAVSTFSGEEEAVHLANASRYGLASAVFTSNIARAHKMVRSIKAGLVHVNCYGGADVTVPLGGLKQSGNGQDKSLHALDKFTDLKTAWINLQ
ncbi:MAG: aldehyde dehydrogenase family protein [Pseudomonadota bacterium]